MAVTATFNADFTKFSTAVDNAVVKLKSFESGSSKVEKSLTTMANSFSGQKIIQQAQLAAAAIERLEQDAKNSGTAFALTGSEMQRAGNLAKEAAEKMRALGLDVPERMQKLVRAIEPLPQQFSLASKAAGVLQSAFAQFTLAGLATSAITGLVSKVGEFIAVGAKLPAVQSSFDRLTSGIKQDGSAMLAAMTTATQGMVSNYDLMLGANKAMLLSLPVTAASMGDLAKTATILGKAMGMDATKSLDDLITALGRSSPMILDNLGLSVKLGEANEVMAQKLGKSADALTDAEKKTAFYNAAMEAARRKTEELGEQTQTLGEIITTVWTKIGNIISGTVGVINVGMGSVLSSMKAFTQFLKDAAGGGVGFAVQMAANRVELERIDKRAVSTRQSLEALMKEHTKAVPIVKAHAASTRDLAKASTTNTTATKLLTGIFADHQRTLMQVTNQYNETINFTKGLDKAGGLLSETYSGRLYIAFANHLNQLQEAGIAYGGLMEQTADLVESSKGLADEVQAGLVESFSSAPELFIQAFTGGGGFSGALKALGVKIADDIIRPLTAKLSKGMQAAIGAGSSGAAAIGGATAGSGGAVVGGVAAGIGGTVLAGSALGGAATAGSVAAMVGLGVATLGVGVAAVGAYIAIKKLINIGKESRETNNARDTWIQELIGIKDLPKAQEAFKKIAAQAGVTDAEVRKVFDTRKVADFTAAATIAANKIAEFAADQEADAQRLTAAIEKYGFTFEQLGPALQKQNLDAQAKEIIEDWRVLIAAGIELGTVNEKMAGSVNEFLQKALKTGTEVPKSMQKIIQTMIDQGQITDDAGNAITDMGQLGITWSETMTEGFDKVVKKLDELIAKLIAAGTAIGDLPGVPDGSGFLEGDQQGPPPDNVPEFAGGTHGLRNFGSGRTVRLHGLEEVRTARQVAASGGTSSAMAEEIGALRGDLARQNARLPFLVRDAVLLAR